MWYRHVSTRLLIPYQSLFQGLEIVQVMFRVGSGEAPAIPDGLTQEGKDFIKMCTIPDAKKRWTAEKLLGHPFVKILDDETN